MQAILPAFVGATEPDVAPVALGYIPSAPHAWNTQTSLRPRRSTNGSQMPQSRQVVLERSCVHLSQAIVLHLFVERTKR